jgi:hypothetical protein
VEEGTAYQRLASNSLPTSPTSYKEEKDSQSPAPSLRLRKRDTESKLSPNEEASYGQGLEPATEEREPLPVWKGGSLRKIPDVFLIIWSSYRGILIFVLMACAVNPSDTNIDFLCANSLMLLTIISLHMQLANRAIFPGAGVLTLIGYITAIPAFLWFWNPLFPASSSPSQIPAYAYLELRGGNCPI